MGTGWKTLKKHFLIDEISEDVQSESSSAGAAAGASVPLGMNATGKPDSRSASKVLNKNAAVYGKSWGDAKPLKETIELLSLLKEESGK
jgi:hypothetical protein